MGRVVTGQALQVDAHAAGEWHVHYVAPPQVGTLIVEVTVRLRGRPVRQFVDVDDDEWRFVARALHGDVERLADRRPRAVGGNDVGGAHRRAGFEIQCGAIGIGEDVDYRVAPPDLHPDLVQ